MNEEKILSFLNLDKQAKHSKFVDKIYMIFNIAFTILIGGCMLLSSMSAYNIAFAISFVVVDLFIVLAVILNKNPAISYIILAIILILLIAKVLIGYVVLSEYDFAVNGIPRFTWLHLAICLLGSWISIHFLRVFHRNYKILKKYPLQKAKRKIQNSYRIPKWLPFASLVASAPMFFVRLLKPFYSFLGIGVGFFLIALSWGFTFMLSMCLYKCIIIIRFKAYRFFK